MFDIITFGSATRDIFLKLSGLKTIKGKSVTGELLVLPSDSKVPIEEIHIKTGGGGTNSAATFKNQGLKVSYCGSVGGDKMGEEIISDLKKRGINTSLVSVKEKQQTNCSVILNSEKIVRTNLIFRGASGLIAKNDIDLNKLKAKWFYFAPFAKENLDLFLFLVDFGYKNKIKIAVNPGLAQLLMPDFKIRSFLKKTDILIVNQEEASLLAKVPYSEEAKIFRKLDELCPGIAIMTKGGEGAVVSDGQYLYSAPSLREKGFLAVDATGAGDAFGSGFVSGFIKKKEIVYAVQLGMANSASCLTKWGAKDGLLGPREKFSLVKVSKKICGKNNNFCRTKQ
jgi:fructokinase